MRKRTIIKTVCLLIFILNIWVVYKNIGNDGLNGPPSILGYAYTKTPTAILYERVYQNRKFEPDPNFDMRPHADGLLDNYPEWSWPEFRSVDSETELQYVKSRIERDIEIDELFAHTTNGKAGWAMVMAYGADPIIILTALGAFFIFARIGKSVLKKGV